MQKIKENIMSKIQLGALVSTSQLDVLSLEQQEIVNGGKKKRKPKPSDIEDFGTQFPGNPKPRFPGL
jgi:hypothetical protein